MGSKEAERKNRKQNCTYLWTIESTNRERDREEDGFCEGEMRAKVCVRARASTERTLRASKPRALDQLLVMRGREANRNATRGDHVPFSIGWNVERVLECRV